MGERLPIRAMRSTDVPQLVSNRFLSSINLDTPPKNPISHRILLRRWRLDNGAKTTLRGYLDDAVHAAVAYAVRRSVPSRHVTDLTLAALGKRYGRSTSSQRWECAGSPSSVAAQSARPLVAGSLTPSETNHRAHPARRAEQKDDANTPTPASRQGDRRTAAPPRGAEPRDDERHHLRRYGSSRRAARLRHPTAERTAAEATPRTGAELEQEAARPKEPDAARRKGRVRSARAGPIQGLTKRKRTTAMASHLGKHSDHRRCDGRSLFGRVADANRRAARSPLDALHMDRFWPPRGQQVRSVLLETGPPHNRGPTQLGHGPPSPPMRRVA